VVRVDLIPYRKEHRQMDSTKYIGMDVHQEAISAALMGSTGKLVMDSVLETKAMT
jgi:hypothetical protein